MYLSLYRKYRPKSFEEMCGVDHILRAIKNALKNNKVSHAYLFNGPRGVGKTTTARLIAKGLNCKTGITDNPCNKCENCLAIDKGNFIDMIEIDAASNRGIDEIRDLKDKINYKPVVGIKKIFIIDEVHMLTKEAFNALLKTLEEPPAHIVFVLATTEIDKILDTIISRCQRYDFLPVAYDAIKSRLLKISELENIKIDEDSLKLIYEKSGGSVRDSISIFEKIASAYFGEEINYDKTLDLLGTVKIEKIKEFIKILKEDKLENSIKFLDLLWQEGISLEDFFRDFSNYIVNQSLILNDFFEMKDSIKIVDIIYETIFKFKTEDDKRLLSYVIISKINEILNKTKGKNVIIKEVYVEKKGYNNIENGNEPINNLELKNSIDFDQIKKDWKKIIEESGKSKISLLAFLVQAFPLKLENNILYIAFPDENKYHKNLMEKKENGNILVNIVNDMYNSSIDIKYEIYNEKKNSNSVDSNVAKVINFFGGEIIEIR